MTIATTDRRVRPYFDYATELSAGDRARFLECLGHDDPALCAAVQRLLAYDLGDDTDGFLASPVRAREWLRLLKEADPEASTEAMASPGDGASRPRPPSPDTGPTRTVAMGIDERLMMGDRLEPPRIRRPIPAIPGYEILGELGRGSTGVVYHACQVRLNRECALKMISTGVHADDETMARFLCEAEAVARLRHPNVVEIHTIGDAPGTPFLELEYVEGGSLDKKLDGTPWAAKDAARLVASLASGLAEAHRLGIVHRDLKPGNVLLARDGTPKVADFGLARLLDSDSGMTLIGMIMGTPSYMAPEQAGGRSREAGAAADLYSLRAILYQLLTGRPQFRGATLEETLEQVKSTEPVPPSRLVPGLPRDLETIALVCLRKEPERRYATAGALAEDLQRFLDGEPILARRSGVLRRAWCWCQRNPRQASSIAIAAISLVAATCLSIALALSQYRAAERLRIEQANTLAEKQNAEELYDIARSTADDFLLRVGEILATPDDRMERIRDLGRTVFETGLTRYHELVARRPQDPVLLSRLGRLYVSLGVLMKNGRGYSSAFESLHQGVAIHRHLAREYPDRAEHLEDLCRSLLNLCDALFALNSYEAGVASAREALAVAEAALATRPGDPAWTEQLAATLRRLGFRLCELGRKDEGIAMLKRAVLLMEAITRGEAAPRERRFNLYLAHVNLGEVLSGEEGLQECLAALHRARSIIEALAREDPLNPDYANTVPVVLHMLGHALYWAGRPADGLSHARKAHALWDSSLGNRPYPLSYRMFRGSNLMTLGQAYQALGRDEEALDSFRQAVAAHRDLIREDPGMYWFPCGLALARRLQGGLLLRAGRQDEALAALKEARTILEAIPEPRIFDRFNLAACLAQMQFLARSGRPVSESGTVPDDDETQQLGDRAMDLLREVAEKSRPRPPRFYFFLDPDIAPLRDRPDFKELVRKLGFAEPPSTRSEAGYQGYIVNCGRALGNTGRVDPG